MSSLRIPAGPAVPEPNEILNSSSRPKHTNEAGKHVGSVGFVEQAPSVALGLSAYRAGKDRLACSALEGGSAYRTGDGDQAETRHKAFPATRPRPDPADRRPAAPRSARRPRRLRSAAVGRLSAGTEAARADLEGLADLLVATRVS